MTDRTEDELIRLALLIGQTTESFVTDDPEEGLAWLLQRKGQSPFAVYSNSGRLPKDRIGARPVPPHLMDKIVQVASDGGATLYVTGTVLTQMIVFMDERGV